jgi:hypothetical protein
LPPEELAELDERPPDELLPEDLPPEELAELDERPPDEALLEDLPPELEPPELLVDDTAAGETTIIAELGEPKLAAPATDTSVR